MTRSATRSLARKMPLWCSRASTSVVLPWSTWAMMATLRRMRVGDLLRGFGGRRHPHQYMPGPPRPCVVRTGSACRLAEGMLSRSRKERRERTSNRSSVRARPHRDRRRGPHHRRAGRASSGWSPRRAPRGPAATLAPAVSIFDLPPDQPTGRGARRAARRRLVRDAQADRRLHRSRGRRLSRAVGDLPHLGCRVHWDDGDEAVPVSVSRRRLRSRRPRRRRAAAARRSSGCTCASIRRPRISRSSCEAAAAALLALARRPHRLPHDPAASARRAAAGRHRLVVHARQRAAVRSRRAGRHRHRARAVTTRRRPITRGTASASSRRRSAAARSCAACITGARASSSSRPSLHLVRVVFFGSYRKPRELNWIVGIAAAARRSSRSA